MVLVKDLIMLLLSLMVIGHQLPNLLHVVSNGKNFVPRDSVYASMHLELQVFKWYFVIKMIGLLNKLSIYMVEAETV